MSNINNLNTSSPKKQFNSLGRSLVINTESSNLQEKSQKSIKSPVNISGGVSFRSSVGMFNESLAQDLVTMKKKKEKLQQIVSIMKNKKEKNLQREQALGQEKNKKIELENRIKMLEEEKIARNMVDIIDPKIKQIEQRVQSIRDKEQKLEISIQEINLSLKSRKEEENKQIRTILDQTSLLQKELQTSDKQIELARKKAESSNVSIEGPQVIQVVELEQAISKLSNSLSVKQKDLQLITQKRTQSLKQSENITVNLKNKSDQIKKKKQQLSIIVNGLQTEKQGQTNKLLTLQKQQSKNYENKLQALKNKNSSIQLAQNTSQTNEISKLKSQQQNLLKELQALQSKSSSINIKDIENKLQSASKQSSTLSEKINTSKQNQESLTTKSNEIHQYKQVITRLNKQVKQLSTETQAVAKKKEDAANVLLQQKAKHQAAVKDNEIHQLHNQLDKLRRKLNDQKVQYSKLQALNKEFVPASMIQEYKNKNDQYENEVKELTVLKNNSQNQAKQVQELRQEKSRLQWADNQTAIDIENTIKSLKNRRGNCIADSKELHKKLNLAHAKVKQYIESYPTFEIKIEKKGSKKKNIQISIGEKQPKQMPIIQQPKQVKEIKQVRQIKQSKKIQTKKKEQQQVNSPLNKQVIKPDPVQSKSSPNVKSKKQKKKTTQAKQEQALIQQILDRQSEQQDTVLLKQQNKNDDNKKKKNKKQKIVKTKKNQQQPKSHIEQQLEYLNQSTKEEGINNNKLPQMLALLILIFGGSVYWFST